MRNYETLEKLVTLTRKMYEGTVCKVIHEGNLIESFEVKTGVRQVFFMLPFLFIPVVDFRSRHFHLPREWNGQNRRYRRGHKSKDR